jgi:16S rRNA (cytidine1402-2'-O)-methyltransferase
MAAIPKKHGTYITATVNEVREMGEYGTLYLVATPIGNMEDITIRAIRTLKEVDLIAAEDTRYTIKLLNKYEIKTPMTSYHGHNEETKGDYIINLLKEGKSVALVSDAGTPGISDPGEIIARKASFEGIKVSPIPGASAAISALIVSACPTGRFVFEGFLPKNKSDKKKRIESFRTEIRTIIIYESPHKLLETLSILNEVIKGRKIALVREITKKFEEVWTGTPSEAIDRYKTVPPKGEFVVVISGADPQRLEEEKHDEWNKLPVEKHCRMYLNQGLDKKEAMKQTARDRGVRKSDIYRLLNKD